ncbi:MAG TPA: hypothetical protein PLB89_13235 [Flavobacteriales bacterium]|nr:hypothetical protein [Flavobacteriales bacterium]
MRILHSRTLVLAFGQAVARIRAKVRPCPRTLPMRPRLRFVPLLLALVSCATLSGQSGTMPFFNEIIVQNSTNLPVTITVTPKHPSMEGQGSTFVLQPGGSTVIGRYSEPDDFVSPVQRMTVSGTVRNHKGKQRTIGVLMMEKRQVSPQHRAWYYQVMGNAGSVGFSF